MPPKFTSSEVPRCSDDPGMPPPESGASNANAADPEDVSAKESASKKKLARSASRGADGADDVIIPTAFEKFVVKYACASCWGFFGIGFIMVMMFGAMMAGEVVEVSTESVWDVRGDIEVEKAHAFLKIEGLVELPTPSSGVEGMERGVPFLPLHIVYEVKSGNIFDPSNQEKMRQVEDKLLTNDQWPENCMMAGAVNGSNPRCAGGRSVLAFTHTGQSIQTQEFQDGFGLCRGNPVVAAQCMASPFSVGRQPCVSSVFNPVVSNVALDSDYDMNLRCMCCANEPGSSGCSAIAAACGNNDNTVLCGRTMQRAQKAARRLNIGKEFTCSTGEALRARSIYTLGSPKPGEEDISLEENYQSWINTELYPSLMEARQEVKTDDFDVYFVGQAFADEFFMSRLIRDQMLGLGAFVIVFMWIWVGTGSAFLALCGMIEIVFSLPMAGMVWGILQMKFISFFMLSIVFLVLGIGADDVFVIWDAYMQSYNIIDETEEDYETKRFAYALRRARCAMLVTSFSTFCGFLACGVSPIPSMSAFGIYGAFVIIFDFFMVITFFASAMVVYTRYFMNSPCQPCSKLRSCIGNKCSGSSQARDLSADEGEPKLRAVEQVFHDRIAPFINKYRVIIAVVWLILGAVGLIVAAVVLRPMKKAPNFFVDDYGKRNMELFTEGFLASEGETRIAAYVILGLNAEEPIDRSGTNYQDPEDTGVVVYDAGSIASLNAPSGQLSLWNLCEQARNFDRVSKDIPCTTRIVNNVRVEDGACMTGAVCFIDWVRDYRIQTQGATAANWHEQEDLYTTLSGPAFTREDGADSEAVFRANAGFDCPGDCCEQYGWYMCLMYGVRTSNGLDFNDWRKGTQWVFEGDALKVAWVAMNTTLPQTALPLAEILPHYDAWVDFLEANKGSLSGPIQTCFMWMWMVTQREILAAVFQSIAACLVLAWLILVAATTNWAIASIALACILVILFLCGGAIAAAGWELGIFEAVGLIVVVGLAVDYSVHICHAYNECRFINGEPATRFQKTQHALTEMGVSVVSGAATTFLASLFLIGATFAFYYVFGIFMLMTVVWSLSVSLSLLPALLCIFGPQGSRGDIVCIRTLAAKLGGILCCRKK